MRNLILLLVGTLMLTGCLTAERAKIPGAESENHVLVRNFGKYLFDVVPICCGNINENPSCPFVLFRNDVTMDKMLHRFYSECRKAGNGEATDIVCHNEHDVMTEFSIWSLSIPIPYIWTSREVQISGNVK